MSGKNKPSWAQIVVLLTACMPTLQFMFEFALKAVCIPH